MDRPATGSHRADGLEDSSAGGDEGRRRPVVPGTTEPATSAEDVLAAAEQIGWPIAIKASAGGGGKGLKIVHSPADVQDAFDSASREGEAYFADAAVYVERYLDDPRHIEVQVLADAHGT